jgi:glycerate dehydrogenase
MTNIRRAVFLDHPSLDLGDLDLSPLRDCFSELQLPQTLPDQVIEHLKGATVAITNKIQIDAAAMAASPS